MTEPCYIIYNGNKSDCYEKAYYLPPQVPHVDDADPDFSGRVLFFLFFCFCVEFLCRDVTTTAKNRQKTLKENTTTTNNKQTEPWV